jgi:VWFA-related protein
MGTPASGFVWDRMGERSTVKSSHAVTKLAWMAPLLFALLAAVRSAGASETAPPVSETLHVRVVNVEVFVTDRKGRPIRDLGVDDFQLFEDGQPVAITNFATVDAAGRLSASSPAGQVPVAERDEEPVARGPHHLVVLVDHWNIAPHSRQRVINRLRSSLESPEWEDTEIMIVGFDGTVERLQSFTTDRAALDAALTSLETEQGRALERGAHKSLAVHDARSVLSRIAEVNSMPAPTTMAELAQIESMKQVAENQFEQLMWEIDREAEETYQDTRRMVGALGAFVRTLAAVPGRKALLYVSDGVAMRPGEEMLFAMEDIFAGGRNLRFRIAGPGESGDQPQLGEPLPVSEEFDSPDVRSVTSFATQSSRRSLAKEFGALADLANTYGVSFYTYAADGSLPSIDTSLGAFSGLEHVSFQAVSQANLWEPLGLLAEETGGSLSTGADLDALLEQVRSDFSGYYSLGFAPRPEGDRKLHKIRVEVRDGRGLRLRYRSSYREHSPERQMQDQLVSAASYSLGDNVGGLVVEHQEPYAAEKRGLFLVPVHVRLPLRSLYLAAEGAERRSHARLFVTVSNGLGQTAPVQEVPFGVEIPELYFDTVKEQEVRVDLLVLTRGGPHRLAVALWDELGGKTSIVHHDVDVVSPGL